MGILHFRWATYVPIFPVLDQRVFAQIMGYFMPLRNTSLILPLIDLVLEKKILPEELDLDLFSIMVI